MKGDDVPPDDVLSRLFDFDGPVPVPGRYEDAGARRKQAA